MNSVYIEITNICNLRCSFCPSGQAATGLVENFDRTFMDSRLFAKCISETQSIADNVYFHVLGEPTLHPDFADFLQMLEETPLKLNLTTNGTTIDHVGDILLNSKAVRQVNFSTHAYAELAPQISSENLQKVLEFCKMAKEKRPELYINLRLWNVGDEQSSQWNEYMLAEVNRTFGTEVTLGHFCSKHKSFLVDGRIYVHQDSRFEWPGGDGNVGHEAFASEIHKGTCRALDTHVAILHDGRVVACCLDYSGQITLGNIQEKKLEAILSGAKATFLREGFAQHQLRHPFCQKCTFCKRFK